MTPNIIIKRAHELNKEAFAWAAALPALKSIGAAAAKSFATGAATTAGAKAVNAITSPKEPPAQNQQQYQQPQSNVPNNNTYIN